MSFDRPMNLINCQFDTESIFINENNNTHSNLDWNAFHSVSSPVERNNCSPIWLSVQEDAVAPNDKLSLGSTAAENNFFFRNESTLFNEFNQQTEIETTENTDDAIDSVHDNKTALKQTIDIKDHLDSPQEPQSSRLSLTNDERSMNNLGTPMASRSSSSRSQCYHKLPDHAVRLMQEWYNANLDNPYPRTPDKKRFISEGHITAQQCRSWFANRRQRMKHVKRNQPKTNSSRSTRNVQTKSNNENLTGENLNKSCEHCCFCQQQQQIEISSSMSPMTLPVAPTTTINVVINQQTIEQLIHNSLRKLLYPALVA